MDTKKLDEQLDEIENAITAFSDTLSDVMEANVPTANMLALQRWNLLDKVHRGNSKFRDIVREQRDNLENLKDFG